MIALKQIIRYTKGTITHLLHLYLSLVGKLIGYGDVDWGGCLDTCNSMFDYYVYLRHNLVSWSTKYIKHIEMNIHFMHEKVARGQVHVMHVSSHYQIVNILKKFFCCSCSMTSEIVPTFTNFPFRLHVY